MQATPPEAHLYQRIARYLTESIEAGTIGAGTRLPSLRGISKQFGCSLSVAVQAYEELERGGLAFSVERSGYFVRAPRQAPEPSQDGARYSFAQRPARPASMLGRIVAVSNNPAVVSLGAGIPAPDLLPLASLRRAIRGVAAAQPDLAGRYGDPVGSNRLRRAVARRLEHRGVFVSPDNVCITNGCIEALSLAIEATTRPGDVVAVEDPVFLGTIQLLGRLNRHIVAIPTTPKDGPDVAFIGRLLKARDVGAIILSPSYQNPTGFVIPRTSARSIVELCVKHDVPIIEDDVYSESSFDGTTVPPLKSLDTEGIVLYCSSVSKTLGPGLRVGWVSPGRYSDEVRDIKTARTLGGSSILQEALCDFVESQAYDKHISHLRSAMKRHARELRELVLQSFPEGTAVTNPSGGFYLWVQLRDGLDSLDLFERALGRGIGIAPGAAFSQDGRYQNYIRLTFGMAVDERVRLAVSELGSLCSA